MVAVLLALGLFIVLLQLGLMALVRRLAQHIEIERARIDKLERHLAPGRSRGGGDEAPVSRLPPEPPPEAAPEPALAAAPGPADAAAAALAPQLTRSSGAPADAAMAGDAARVDPAQLRGEMLGLMRQLVDQGLSVRDIAARCGLSQAEAELMLSLHGSEHG